MTPPKPKGGGGGGGRFDLPILSLKKRESTKRKNSEFDKRRETKYSLFVVCCFILIDLCKCCHVAQRYRGMHYCLVEAERCGGRRDRDGHSAPVDLFMVTNRKLSRYQRLKQPKPETREERLSIRVSSVGRIDTLEKQRGPRYRERGKMLSSVRAKKTQESTIKREVRSCLSAHRKAIATHLKIRSNTSSSS